MSSGITLIERRVEDGEPPEVIVLHRRDVRASLDEAVRRVWTEHTRRVARVLVLLAGDTLAGLAAVAAALSTWELVSAGGVRPLPNPVPLVAMVLCIQPLALRVTGAYGGGTSRVSLGRIALALAIAGLVGWLQARLFGELKPNLPNKTAFVYSATLISVAVFAWRVAFDRAVKLGFRLGLLQRRVLLIGHREDVEQVQRRIDHTPASDVHVAGALSPNALGQTAEGLKQALRRCGAHSVVIAAQLPAEKLERVVQQCFDSGVSVSLLPRGLQQLGASYFELRQSGAGVLLHVLPLRFGLPQLLIKRTMDLVLTTCGLLVLWPLFIVIAIAIKLDSEGPVLFRQERVGVGGKPFRMLKFRTMHVGADERKRDLLALNESGDPRLFKIKNDPRVTRVGRILRRTSLDELPQLFNVLKGEMSLVGPRPFFGSDLPEYQRHHIERLHVLPGVTGLWQVSGRSDVVDFEEVVRLDREYIQKWSIAADFVILLKTIPAALGRGAY